MGFSASGGCYQPIHQVPRRSSVSYEHSSKVRLSGFSSFIPVGARLFCLGMLARLLTLPCTYRVEAVTFAFRGFQENDVHMVSDSPWTFQSNTSGFYFDPPGASRNKSVPGRFLYPNLVQMKDPVTKRVKSSGTTFIYQIQIQQPNRYDQGYISSPGMAFIVVPDNVTVGAASDYMGLLTTDTSTSAKNYESDNHTLGVELDTFRNPEFHDPDDNHIGLDLASMNSTFVVNPAYPLCSFVKNLYKQIWIDYFEADSRMDIYHALYLQGKPAKPQGSQTGVDLSLLLENMFIGFSTAKGIESDNVPYVYAWSFSNDGIPAPAIVMGLNATSASLAADGPLGATIEVPPSPSLAPTSTSLPSRSPLPLSMANLLSPNIRAPRPTPVAKKKKRLNLGAIVGIVVSAIVLGICLPGLLCWHFVFRHPLRIFIDKILCEGRRFASNLCWTKTIVVEKVILVPPTLKRSGIEKRKKCANQRAGKENSLMTYINKWLQLLCALFGLLNVLFSVVLDNSFNDQPIRFIAFAIFTPITMFLGFLASGWFPQIPLRLIAFVKRHGFLQQVVPCSPWHDNVITDYCGEVCTLEPLEQAEGTRFFELPTSIQIFLYGNWNSPQGTTTTTTIHSTFDPKIQDFQVATFMQEGQDLQGLSTRSETFDFSPLSRNPECSHLEMATNQALLPNLQEAPSQVGDITIDLDDSFVFHILGNEQVSILEFDGPKINGIPLKVQASKNTSTKDHTFDLSCTFRNKRTKKMYLTTKRLQNLVENMCQWVENPYPIVVDKSSNILHCMAIEDILWEFTQMVYTFIPVYVKHRFLAGLGHIKFFVTLSYVSLSFLMSLLPLLSDKRSFFFLFFLFIVVPYLIVLDDTNPLTLYRFKSLFCPIFVKIYGFNSLYKSRSSYRWCNEFRKKRIVNPTHFWIDEEYANTCPDVARCLDVCGFLELPDSLPKDESFIVNCQGWPIGVPERCKKQHDYKLRVKFDSVKLIKDVNCYTNVRLAFFENDYLLGKQSYTFIEVQRVHLVEKFFHCFSNPSFGGYVEKICSRGYCSTTFVAHCPRFVDFCQTIFCSNPIPKLLLASRMPGSEVIVGVPF